MFTLGCIFLRFSRVVNALVEVLRVPRFYGKYQTEEPLNLSKLEKVDEWFREGTSARKMSRQTSERNVRLFTVETTWNVRLIRIAAERAPSCRCIFYDKCDVALYSWTKLLHSSTSESSNIKDFGSLFFTKHGSNFDRTYEFVCDRM